MIAFLMELQVANNHAACHFLPVVNLEINKIVCLRTHMEILLAEKFI